VPYRPCRSGCPASSPVGAPSSPIVGLASAPSSPTGGLPSTGASRHGCVRPGGGGGGGHAAEQGPAAAVRTSREKRRREVVGPAMHGDAHWRLSPGLATFSSLSSFLSPTCHLVERLTTPTASALNVNLYLFWP
jgi:hypothetical protein